MVLDLEYFYQCIAYTHHVAGIITFVRPDGIRMIYGGRVEKIIEVLIYSASTDSLPHTIDAP